MGFSSCYRAKSSQALKLRVGLAISSLTSELITTLEKEEDIEKIIADGNQSSVHEDD